MEIEKIVLKILNILPIKYCGKINSESSLDIQLNEAIECIGDFKREFNTLSEQLLYFKRLSLLQREGWEFESISMYDEEGVEGWKWISPRGEEFCEIGSWDEMPEIPQEVEEISDSIIRSRNIE